MSFVWLISNFFVFQANINSGITKIVERLIKFLKINDLIEVGNENLVLFENYTQSLVSVVKEIESIQIELNDSSKLITSLVDFFVAEVNRIFYCSWIPQCVALTVSHYTIPTDIYLVI